MAWEIPNLRVSLLAGEDLSSSQFYCVKLNATDNTIVKAGAGESVLGILQDTPASSYYGSVECTGISKAVFGATVTAGQLLMSDANGKLIPHTGTNNPVAVAIEGGAAGEVGTVFLGGKSAAGHSTHYSMLSIPIKLSKIADGDIVTDLAPGFSGSIQKAQFLTTDPATTASKASTLSLEINSTPITGGNVALTTVACNTLGKVTQGSTITAANSFGASDTISVVASSTTAFVEGEGVLVLTLI